MAQDYKFKPNLSITGGYNGEWQGVYPIVTNWENGVPGHDYGTKSYEYYYTDSNTADDWPADQKNANSSRVSVYASDSWEAEFDDNNNLIITITTTISQMKRWQISGNPNLHGTYGRDIQIGRSASNIMFTKNNDPINTTHTIFGTLNLGTEVITIPPGETGIRSSIYIKNHTSGLAELPIYTDIIYAGIFFQNNAPKDYRPGATYIAGTWQSHNRSNGACDGFQGTWTEQRTEAGGTGTGNPPLYYGTDWRNQYKVGENG